MDRMTKHLVAVETLPEDMREHALVDWATAARICGYKDIEYCREVITKAGVPLVQLSERRRLPTWGALRAWLKSRESAAAQIGNGGDS
jgi:hypothetical protein